MAETWIIKTADGEEYLFKTLGSPGDMSYDSMYHVLKGASGHHGMEVSFTSDVVPNIAGEELRDVIIGTRTIYMPIRVQGTTPANMHRNLARLRRSLDPKKDCQLWITNNEGETRVLYCRYSDGFDKLADDDKQGSTWRVIQMHLTAFDDPYFYDIPGNEITYSVGFVAPTKPFFDSNPWFCTPWRVGKSMITDLFTLYNPGDDDALPIWTINGPGMAPVLENVTTGDALGLKYNLSNGEVVTIDMQRKTITSEVLTSDGIVTANLRKYIIQNQRDMWGVQPGPNDIALELSHCAEGMSAVTITFLPRYKGI